jgi:hypothetical protein
MQSWSVSHGSRIITLVDWHSDSNHLADLAIRRVARISVQNNRQWDGPAVLSSLAVPHVLPSSE